LLRRNSEIGNRGPEIGVRLVLSCVTYDQGQLEMMRPSLEHAALKDTVALLVNTLAEEMRINTRSFGSATFRRPDLQRGFEPDGCFYVQSVTRMRGNTALDLTIDPPPDLVIELELTSPSLPQFPIFAPLGVPEVWRAEGRQIHIFCRAGGQYVEHAASSVLPDVTAEVLTGWVHESHTLDRLTWLRRVREWVHQRATREA